MESSTRQFLVVCGEERCKVSFALSTPIQETFSTIASLIHDATGTTVQVRALKSGGIILMKTVTVGELIMQGEEVTAVLEGDQKPAPPPVPVAAAPTYTPVPGCGQHPGFYGHH